MAKEKYTTHTCKTEDLPCANCFHIIPIDAEFAVLNTPSRAYENTCLGCADKRIEDEGAGIVDATVGKHPGKERTI